MPYSPGVVDRSGEIRAQGMLQGGMGVLAGIDKSVDAWKKNKEEEKKLQASIKSAEALIQSISPIATQINPEFDKIIKDLSLKVSDPKLSTLERATLSQNALKGIGDLMGSGLELKKMQAEQARQQQVAQAQMEADKARAQQAIFAKTVDELIGLGAANNGQLDPRLIEKVGPAAYGAAQMQLQKVYGRGSGAQTFPTLQEAQMAAQGLKSISGTVPTIKFENGAYVVETVGKAPGTDRMEEVRADIFKKGVDTDIMAGQAARKMAPAVNRLSQLLEKDGVETGVFAQSMTDIRALGKAMGINVDESKLANSQEARTYMSRFFLDYVREMKGAISDKETAILQSLGPEMEKDTETNKRLIRMTKERIGLEQKIEGLAQKWARKKLSEDEYLTEREKLIEEYDSKIDKIFEAAKPVNVELSPQAQRYLQ